MSRDEHLDKIVAKCRELTVRAELLKSTAPSQMRIEAGWRATIAAIEQCRDFRSPDTGEVLDAICDAWPEELL